MSKLYILTLTWNGQNHLGKLKESMLPALHNINYEWLIKDNASTDDTVSMASSWGQNIKIFPYKDNKQNFSEGMNYLFNEIRPADDDLIFLLNNDVVFNDTKSIKNMMNIIESDDEVGAVGCRLLYNNTSRIQHAGVVFGSRKTPFHWKSNQLTNSSLEKDREFQAVTGAALITKAKYYREICKNNKSGICGMDEKYHWAFDDIDMCLSIKYNMKKKIAYCGNTNIFHEESASLKKTPTNKLFMNSNLNCLRNKWQSKIVMDSLLYLNDDYNLYKK